MESAIFLKPDIENGFPELSEINPAFRSVADIGSSMQKGLKRTYNGHFAGIWLSDDDMSKQSLMRCRLTNAS